MKEKKKRVPLYNIESEEEAAESHEPCAYLLSFIACFVNVVKVGMIGGRLAQQILKVALITGQPLNL